MRKSQSLQIIILLSLSLLLLQSGTAYSAKNVYIYNGDINVLDGISDKVLETVEIRSQVRNIYEIKAFPKANTLFLKGEYQIYTIDFEMQKILEDTSISTEWEHVAFLPSPDGSYFYVIWLPQNYITASEAGKRKISRFDGNLKSKVIDGLDFKDDMQLLDFSRDGTQLYIVRDYKPSRIQVMDFKSNKIMKEYSFDEIGRRNVFSKVAWDISNNIILFSETIKNANSYQRFYYVYDIDNNKISTNIEMKTSCDCKLMTNGRKIVCDEEARNNDSTFRLGKLHFYDVQSGKEIGHIDISSNLLKDHKKTSSYNEIAGITPDGNKIYYRTWRGTIVIDAERYKIIRTLDHLGGLMSFSGY